MRLEGATYQEIAERGGGILNSAKALQAMGEDELFDEALRRVHHAISQGVGAMEIKSGYGLTLDAERKMLRVIARLKEAAPIPIKATFLGCHAVPPEFDDAAAYTQHVVNDMLPAFAASHDLQGGGPSVGSPHHHHHHRPPPTAPRAEWSASTSSCKPVPSRGCTGAR